MFAVPVQPEPAALPQRTGTGCEAGKKRRKLATDM